MTQVNNPKFCYKCGNPLRESSKFCDDCGIKLSENDINPDTPNIKSEDKRAYMSAEAKQAYIIAFLFLFLILVPFWTIPSCLTQIIGF